MAVMKKATKPTLKGMSTTESQTKITGSLKKPGMGTSSGKGDLKVTPGKKTVKFTPETKQSMGKMKKAPAAPKTGTPKPLGPKRISPSQSKSIVSRTK